MQNQTPHCLSLLLLKLTLARQTLPSILEHTAATTYILHSCDERSDYQSGKEVIERIFKRHGVPGRNSIGEVLLEISAEIELVDGNSFSRNICA